MDTVMLRHEGLRIGQYGCRANSPLVGNTPRKVRSIWHEGSWQAIRHKETRAYGLVHFLRDPSHGSIAKMNPIRCGYEHPWNPAGWF